MRTGLVVFGIIFLVIGALLYLVPGQEFRANTTTVGDGNVDSRTSSASVSVPVEWAYASMGIGLILLILGFVIPSTKVIVREEPHDETHVIQTKENIEIGKGKNRKIVRERTERHVGK